MAVPDARLILAHAHGPGFAQLLVYDIVGRYPQWQRNVWIDISVTGPLLAGGPFAEQFAWVLRKVGTDRVIFGSDYPLDDPMTAARAVADLGFTVAEQAAILHDKQKACSTVNNGQRKPGQNRNFERTVTPSSLAGVSAVRFDSCRPSITWPASLTSCPR